MSPKRGETSLNIISFSHATQDMGELIDTILSNSTSNLPLSRGRFLTQELGLS